MLIASSPLHPRGTSAWLSHCGLLAAYLRPPVEAAMTQRRLHIMIVDDDPHTRTALAAYISTQDGLTVIHQAGNAPEAIELAARETPDVVLVDVRIPAGPGLEAARTLREQWPQARLIVLATDPYCREEALDAGVNAFLLKGADADKLICTIRSAAAK